MKLVFADTPPDHVFYTTLASPVGKLAIGLTDKGQICLTAFLHARTLGEVIVEWQSVWDKTRFKRGAPIEKAERKTILLTGTKFQQSVWTVIAKIPSGSITTYGHIADYIGNPNASRAVGAACGANPVPYFVPCHRVLAANGGLGGFTGGLEIKKKLLRVEGYLA